MTIDIDSLTADIRALEPQPRTVGWTSLTYCVLDAVWSIGSDYDDVVTPLVRNVALTLTDQIPVAPLAEVPTADAVPLTTFLAHYPDTDALLAQTNRQRTSTRSGILKAEAARRFAQVLVDHNVTTLNIAQGIASGGDIYDAVNVSLAEVPGEGQYGIRRSYFWMLVGDDQGVKPDRMVMRWLRRRGFTGEPGSALSLIRQVAKNLSDASRTYTPWEIDHAIWLAEKPN
ncbi:hypothetical protein [Georgenia daeguensis]|uniref:Uncharacterized protein n=1 Tax=Georgenia daeguensis TaxID=908355 RepID=A0ABP6UR26_9MICO